jgi:hypothetical protein
MLCWSCSVMVVVESLCFLCEGGAYEGGYGVSFDIFIMECLFL